MVVMVDCYPTDGLVRDSREKLEVEEMGYVELVIGGK